METKRSAGEGEFASFHPLVLAVFYLLAIGITMFSMDPLFLGMSCVSAWVSVLFLKGKQVLKKNFVLSGSVLFLMTGINTLFTHNGETVLFYINRNRVTLEAFVYGICASVMPISVILWFESFQVLMSSDKLIYLFGRIAPVLGLVISMIFRFIPLLKVRFGEISMGQKCMGRGGQIGFLNRCRQLVKELSILIAWSLEASIESADSMAARGYGLRGRTSFHLFRMTGRDTALLLFFAAAGCAVIAGTAAGYTTMQFYPRLVIETAGSQKILVFLIFAVLVWIPFIIDRAGEYKWKKSEWKN